ncbi:DNA cytosine methyltransferase [Pantoea sp. SJZ147]|uniref:DNA cytosine methyltransferase n=1 Tax=Pantoea sp. SJZ147 TaxID=2572896 RepID=UPI0011ABDA7A|nr:DNA (cytosine-5-)-methyltransferase [Pantoea sp. SJZ147]TWD44038.1 DNA (cytosine-5)-methyltransferase 1 [Pantoea sp. SJZ147]
MKKKKFTMNSFFAGIGGFDLAFENAGFATTFQCELNKFCLRILEEHWPTVPRFEDIQSLNVDDVPEATVWCGGFPCQDVSVARGAKGRLGLKGKNSGLFFPFISLIEAKKPPVVLLENVTGLLTSHNGQDFRVILERLTSLGYIVSWRVMNSRFFGAPQSRPRVFICAALNGSISLASLYEKEKGKHVKNIREGFLNISHCIHSGAKVADVAYCLAATSGRHTGTDWSRTYVSYDSAVRRMTPKECEGVQGFPLNWTLPLYSSAKSEDIDSERYHALGNAVAVPVVEWIAKRLHKVLKDSNTNYINTNSNVESMMLDYPDILPDDARTQVLSKLHFDTLDNNKKLRWLSGGVAFGDVCYDFKVPDAPSKPKLEKLISVIEKINIDDRYFISPNAAEGILRRVDSQNRKLFPPLYEALMKLSKKKNVA